MLRIFGIRLLDHGSNEFKVCYAKEKDALNFRNPRIITPQPPSRSPAASSQSNRGASGLLGHTGGIFIYSAGLSDF